MSASNQLLNHYRLQPTFDKRTTTLGIGSKYDFTKNDKWIPGPQAYDLKSCFESQKHLGKGVKFAYGRKELQKQGLLGNINKNPGPGSYNPKEVPSTAGYTLHDRTAAPRTIKKQFKKNIDIYLVSKTPAPGAYNIGGIHEKGVYILGKHRNSCASVFSPTSSILNTKVRTPRVPGPGTYDPPGNIKDANEHMPSHYKNQPGWHFNSDLRKTQQFPHLKSNQILITKKIKPLDLAHTRFPLNSEIGSTHQCLFP